MTNEQAVNDRLEYLRGEIEAERISYGEIAELQGLAEHIEDGDVLLLQWAGVPEFPEEEDWPLPALTASTGNIYAAKPEDGDGFPSIGIAWMDRDEPNTVPVQRDAYLNEIVKRCNAYPSMVAAINKAIEAPSLEAGALAKLRESIK